MRTRVTRILVYDYADAEGALKDMERWQVPANGTKSNIRSAVLPPEFLEGPTAPAALLSAVSRVRAAIDNADSRADPAVGMALRNLFETADELPHIDVDPEVLWVANEAISLLREARGYVSELAPVAAEIDEALPDFQAKLERTARRKQSRVRPMSDSLGNVSSTEATGREHG